MTPQQLIRTILDAVAEDDLRKAEDAIAEYEKERCIHVLKGVYGEYGKYFAYLQVIRPVGIQPETEQLYLDFKRKSFNELYELFTQQNKP